MNFHLCTQYYTTHQNFCFFTIFLALFPACSNFCSFSLSFWPSKYWLEDNSIIKLLHSPHLFCEFTAVMPTSSFPLNGNICVSWPSACDLLYVACELWHWAGIMANAEEDYIFLILSHRAVQTLNIKLDQELHKDSNIPATSKKLIFSRLK